MLPNLFSAHGFEFNAVKLIFVQSICKLPVTSKKEEIGAPTKPRELKYHTTCTLAS
jgi:hypothetical protein